MVQKALAAVDAVDWPLVRDCYGPAAGLPDLLRATLSPEVEERRSALAEARNQVRHQGDTCEASLYVVPFLVQAALGAPGDREAFVYWLAWSCDPREDAETERSGFLGRVREAVAGQFAVLAPLLNDPDPAMRRAMVMLAAACPRAVVDAVADLRGLADEDQWVRADVLTALEYRFADWPGLEERLLRSLSDPAWVVRYQAARVLMRRSGPPFDPRLVDVVADVLARHAAPDGELKPIESLCHGPEPDPAQADGPGPVLVRVLDRLVQDPHAALRAAGRITRSGEPHAGYGIRLAGQVVDSWRDCEAQAAKVLLAATPAAAGAATALLGRVAPLAERIAVPDPALLAAAAAWSRSPQPAVAGAALAVLARLGDPAALDSASRAAGPEAWPSWALAALGEVFGRDAAFIMPAVRERLARLDHRSDRNAARPLFDAIRSVGPGAQDAVTDLAGLLERRVLTFDAIAALGALGPAALPASQALAGAAAGSNRPLDLRVRAAAAHRAVTGEDAVARQAAAIVLKTGATNWTELIEALGLLGPAAADCVPLIEAALARPHDRDQACVTLWQITGDPERCTPLLARAVTPSAHAGLDALRALKEAGACPPQCVPLLRQIAGNPVRMLLSGWREPPRRDDDLLRDAARQLLDLHG